MTRLYCLNRRGPAGTGLHDIVSHSISAHAMSGAFTVSAAVLLVAVGVRGALAEYLSGGINDEAFDPSGLFVLFMLDDTATWFAWWGVLLTGPFAAWLAFRLRVLSRWLGAVGVVAFAFPVVVFALTGAVADAGIAGPVWLAVSSVAIAIQGLGSTHAVPRSRVVDDTRAASDLGTAQVPADA